MNEEWGKGSERVSQSFSQCGRKGVSENGRELWSE